jgi:hypothetical protein
LSGQLESRHYFRKRDSVQHLDGYYGTVVDSQALYATIRWEDESEVEIDQFDPSVTVVLRAEPE